MYSFLKQYNIFISHAWDYKLDYEKIKEWLNDGGIAYYDYSISSDKAYDDITNKELKEHIFNHIQHASVVIIMAGMYVSYSRWIDYEINTAVRMNKPIVAVKPRGNVNIPFAISHNDIPMVNWNSDSVVNAVKAVL